jgi:hypothetical protein
MPSALFAEGQGYWQDSNVIYPAFFLINLSAQGF